MEEALEYDFMSGVLMLSTKRYTQAVENFRKIQGYYLKEIEKIKSNTNPDIKLKTAKLF